MNAPPASAHGWRPSARAGGTCRAAWRTPQARSSAPSANKDADTVDRSASAGTMTVMEGFRGGGVRDRRALFWTPAGSPRPVHTCALALHWDLTDGQWLMRQCQALASFDPVISEKSHAGVQLGPAYLRQRDSGPQSETERQTQGSRFILSFDTTVDQAADKILSPAAFARCPYR